MTSIIIYIAVFCGVAALVGAIAFIMRGDKEAEVEERLSALTAGKKGRGNVDAAQYKELLNADEERQGERDREVCVAVPQFAAAVRTGQRIDGGREFCRSFAARLVRLASCLPSVGRIERGAGAGDGAVPGRPADRVAVDAAQATAEEVRFATAAGARTDRPRLARRA